MFKYAWTSGIDFRLYGTWNRCISETSFINLHQTAGDFALNSYLERFEPAYGIY
jgi:hypothetical protein